MQTSYEIQEFFVEGGDREESHVLLHITEPSTSEEYPRGVFFMLADLEHGTYADIELLQSIASQVEREYYQGQALDPIADFEKIIERINRKSHRLGRQGETTMSCIMGIKTDRTLAFAAHGHPRIHLLYKSKDDDGLDHIDLYPEAESGDGEAQLFSSLIQGAVNSGDIITITTEPVAEYFPIDRIKQFLSGKTLRNTSDHIQQFLEDLKNNRSFGGLFLRVLKPHERVPVKQRGPALIPTAREDHERVKEKIKKDPRPTPQIAPSSETNYRPRSTSNTHQQDESLLIVVARAAVSLCRVLVQGLISLARLISRVLVGLWLIITNMGGQRETVIDAGKDHLRSLKQKIGDLPLLIKLGVLVLCLLVVGVVGASSYRRMNEVKIAKIEHERMLVEQIRDKISAADASLIYKDEAKAKTLLDEAKTLIPGVTDTETYGETLKDYEKEISDTLLQLRKITTVQSTQIADIRSVGFANGLTKLARLKDTLIAYSENDEKFSEVDLTTKKVEAKELGAVRKLKNSATPKEQDAIYFVMGDNGIAAYNPTNHTIEAKEITHIGATTALTSIMVYNQRLYALDAPGKTIYRYNKTQTGFDKGIVWLKDATDLSLGVSLAIDGDVFILEPNGVIKKFTAGKAIAFPTVKVDPPLMNAAALWTYADVNTLYILDPIEKRLIALRKDGSLIAQYTDPAWQKPTDMVIDDAKKIAYILDGARILEVKLP